MKEKELKRKIMNYVCHKIGTSIYLDSFKHHKGTNKVYVSLGYSIPKVIYDDEQRKQFVKFIRFPDIARLEFTIKSTGEVYTDYDIAAIYETINKKQYRLQKKIERILLDEIYPKLFDVSVLRNMFRPIYNILNHIWLSGKLTYGEWLSSNERKKLMKYLKFLENMDMIRQDKNKDYVMGNIPTEIKHALRNNNNVEVLKKLFGYSLKEGKKYLKEELHVPMVDVYIEIISTYYYLASRINKTVKITANTFYEEFKSLYEKSKVDKTKFFSYLTDLTEAGILGRSNNFFFGEEDILRKLEQAC